MTCLNPLNWIKAKGSQGRPPKKPKDDKKSESPKTDDKDKVDHNNSSQQEEKNAPNPYGKKGGPAHQAGVEKVIADIKAKGRDDVKVVEEYRVITPEGNSRYVDVAVIDSKGNPIGFHQVGKQNKTPQADGQPNPIARERRAINDINRTHPNVPVTFHPYN